MRKKKEIFLRENFAFSRDLKDFHQIKEETAVMNVGNFHRHWFCTAFFANKI